MTPPRPSSLYRLHRASLSRWLVVVFLAFARSGQMLAQSAAQALEQGAAQSGPAMATGLRADGKIWVVVGVILIILLGLLAYLVSLDRRIAKAEAQLND